MKQRAWITTMAVLFILLAGCAPGAPKDSGEFIRGEAMVEDVEILFLESFPLGVHAVAIGYLPDPCTEIDEISVERDGNHFKVLITTLREAEVM
jgi:inhibitor of cysteine peptidase